MQKRLPENENEDSHQPSIALAPAAWGASDLSENVGVALLMQSSSDNDRVSEANKPSSGWSTGWSTGLSTTLEDQLLKLPLPIVLL